jgi:hypothetical protein
MTAAAAMTCRSDDAEQLALARTLYAATVERDQLAAQVVELHARLREVGL